MEETDKNTVNAGLMDRIRRSWIAPLAALGAFAAIVAAAFRTGPTPQNAGSKTPGGMPQPAAPQGALSPSPIKLEQEYSKSVILGGNGSGHPFRRSLDGIAVGSGDRVYALGDGEVRTFEPGGDYVSAWKAPGRAACLHVGADGSVYIGAPGRVEIFDRQGSHIGGFAAGEAASPAEVTCIKSVGKEILIADSAARYIRRYDSSGRQLGEIGTQNKTRSFMLPNRWLVFDVDSKGVVHATDTGRHQVTTWALDGSPLGSFGKFGMTDPSDFVGCCNPVNLAVFPDGRVVTGEKMIARVKVYEPGGRLLAFIGPENFDSQCTHIYLAVDSKGRIIAGDPVRREVTIFARVIKGA